MDARPDRACRRGDGRAPEAPSSDRLQLEVVLLAAAGPAPLPSPDPAGAGAATHTVLVAAATPDMRGYIRECLQARADLRVLEVDGEEPPCAAARRLGPDLIIAELPALRAGEGTAGPPRAPVPLLLIVEELPDDAVAWPQRPGAPLAFLLQPFNARSLHREVERLLAAAGARRGLPWH
jgi:hypothetical protein